MALRPALAAERRPSLKPRPSARAARLLSHRLPGPRAWEAVWLGDGPSRGWGRPHWGILALETGTGAVT